MITTAVSLFAGIGGFDLAMAASGINVTAAVEIDRDCRGVLARYFPETELFTDVKEINGSDLKATGFIPQEGIITAGWPCQGNSVAGRRGGMADPRSGLWGEVVRLLAESRPRYFVGENVPGLLTVNGGRDFLAVIRSLDELGYGYGWRVLDAQYFGVPQRRKRVIIVASLGDGAGPAEILFEPESGHRDSAPGPQPGTRIAGTLAASANSGSGHIGQSASSITSRIVETTVPSITSHYAKGADSDATFPMVVSTLQGGGRRGYRADAEGAAGGHLLPVPYAVHGANSNAKQRHAYETDTSRCLDTSGANMPNGGGMVVLGEQEQEPIPVALRGRDGGTQLEAGQPGDPAHTVRTPGGGGSYPMIAHTLTSGVSNTPGVNPPGRRHEDDHNLVCVTGETTHPLTAHSGARRGSEDGTGRGVPIVNADPAYSLSAHHGHDDRENNYVTHRMGVRRLTPKECERLQGFPDDWTAGQSDSARYRQLGNAVAVPVAAWVTRRIAHYDSTSNHNRKAGR